MEVPAIVIGVDVGKFFHYLWAENEKGQVILRRRIDNTEKALRRALEMCGEPKECLVVTDQPHNIGACCVRVAFHLGFQVAYIAADAMRKEAVRQGETSKTDRSDAKVICHAAKEAPALLKKVVSDPTKAKVKALRARDIDLMHDEVRAQNRLRAALMEAMPEFEAILKDDRIRQKPALLALVKFGGPWSMKRHVKAAKHYMEKVATKSSVPLVEKVVETLKAVSLEPDGIAEIEALTIGAAAKDLLDTIKKREVVMEAICTLLEEDEDYKNLLTMPGIGKRTAATIVSEVKISDFPSPHKFARYAGIAPRVSMSGTSIKQIFSDRRGNSRLRHALFTSAAAVLAHDTQSYAFYRRKRREGKSYAAAVLALARKRLKVIYAILRDKKPYTERPWELIEAA